MDNKSNNHDIELIRKKILSILGISLNSISSRVQIWENDTGLSLKIKNGRLPDLSQIFRMSYFSHITALTLDKTETEEVNYLPPHLEHVRIVNNPIKNFNPDLPNLQSLAIEQAPLDQVEIERFPNLTYLEISRTKLEKIDLSKNIQLEYLLLTNNKLKNIEVRQLSNLIFLDLSFNQLTSLDVIGMDKLQLLFHDQNYIEDLNVDRPELLHNILQNRWSHKRLDSHHIDALYSFFKFGGFKVPDCLKYFEEPHTLQSDEKVWRYSDDPPVDRFP